LDIKVNEATKSPNPPAHHLLSAKPIYIFLFMLLLTRSLYSPFCHHFPDRKQQSRSQRSNTKIDTEKASGPKHAGILS
jgi:hypothetical protein